VEVARVLGDCRVVSGEALPAAEQVGRAVDLHRSARERDDGRPVGVRIVRLADSAVVAGIAIALGEEREQAPGS